MMNLVSRYHVRDPNVLASTASESPVKTKSESQNVPLSSLNVQQTSTGRPVLSTSSSNYSEWNALTTRGLLKCGNLVKCRTQVRGDPKVTSLFVIDDDTDSDTATESNLSLKITFIAEPSEWSIAKDVGPFSRRCNARHRQTFYDLGNVYVFDIGSICIHGKELLIKKYREKPHFKAHVRDI